MEPKMEMEAVDLAERSIPDVFTIDPDIEKSLKFFAEADANDPKFLATDEFKHKNGKYEVELEEFKIAVEEFKLEGPKFPSKFNHENSKFEVELDKFKIDVEDFKIERAVNLEEPPVLGIFNDSDNVIFTDNAIDSKFPAISQLQTKNGKYEVELEEFKIDIEEFKLERFVNLEQPSIQGIINNPDKEKFTETEANGPKIPCKFKHENSKFEVEWNKFQIDVEDFKVERVVNFEESPGVFNNSDNEMFTEADANGTLNLEQPSTPGMFMDLDSKKFIEPDANDPKIPATSEFNHDNSKYEVELEEFKMDIQEFEVERAVNLGEPSISGILNEETEAYGQNIPETSNLKHENSKFEVELDEFKIDIDDLEIERASDLEEPSVSDVLIDPDNEKFSEADANGPKFPATSEFRQKNGKFEVDLDKFKIDIDDLKNERAINVREPSISGVFNDMDDEKLMEANVNSSKFPATSEFKNSKCEAELDKFKIHVEDLKMKRAVDPEEPLIPDVFTDPDHKKLTEADGNELKFSANSRLVKGQNICDISDSEDESNLFRGFSSPISDNGCKRFSSEGPSDSVEAKNLNSYTKQKLDNLKQDELLCDSGSCKLNKLSIVMDSMKSFNIHLTRCKDPGLRQRELKVPSIEPSSEKSSAIYPFCCDKCCERFEFKAYLIVHELFHHNKNCKYNKDIKCPECQAKFRSKRDLAAHISLHTDEKFFKCKECPYACRKKECLKFHIVVHHSREERPYKCDHCDVSFYKQHELKIHIRNHTGVRPYECKKCGRTFVRTSALTKHQTVHTKEPTFICEVCFSRFKTKGRLESHVERRHTEIPDFIECLDSSCSKVFPHSKRMRQHFYLCHNLNKIYSCAHCNFTVKSKPTLISHMKKHGFKQLVECKQCKQRFSSKGSLYVHCNTQHRAKRYICEQCGTAFGRMNYFKVHLLKHFDSGGRSYVCADCGADFYMKHHLQNHVKIHLRKK